MCCQVFQDLIYSKKKEESRSDQFDQPNSAFLKGDVMQKKENCCIEVHGGGGGLDEL